ncbi:recombinase family protein [Klebsiella grimontii]|uniref:recombinase family protein n=1 Tax=Klebsiella grimontii TaxID=2058152 RepID=UPI0015EA9EA9|nr:recombinase family protein [Klebsiella grimontii]QMR63793.1 recombinase family protein [Klebsiella grimontii]
MPKAISYIRFSTKIQSVGDSTKRQSKYINDWLKRNPDYYLDESLRFQDLGISGFSGANAKSGAFSEFLAAVESGYIEAGSVLLVESLDRVSRQDIDTAGEQLRKILRSGVEVVTLVDNEWYTKESLKDSLSMIKAMLVMERAHEESAMKSTRLRSVWAAKRERAAKGEIMSKRCAAWLKVSEDRSHFEFIPENVKAVQRVFQLRLEGLSHVKIAKQMNDEGFSTLNQFKSVTGGWSQSSVTELLSNRSVIGFKVPSKSMAVKGVSEIPNYYPSIITDEQFYAVQQLKQGSGRKPSSDLPLLTNLFKGVLRCSECGFIVVVAGVSAKRSGIYKCSMKSEGRCNSVGFSRLQTDRALVQGLLYNTNRLALNRDNGSAIGSLQSELEQLQKQRERLIKLAMLADDTESMAKDLKALNSQIKDAEKAVSEVHQREQSSQLETISHLDLTVKKDRIEAQIIIKRIVKEIRLNTAKKRCDVFLHNGLKLLSFPLDRVVDGAQWLEILPLIDGDEFDFEGFTTKPRHLVLEEAPEWVKEIEAQPNQPL